MRSAALGIVASLVALDLANAADPKGASLTVVPWSGALVSFAENEKRLDAAFSDFVRGPLFGRLELSAPLDAESREAAFLDEHRLASGFTASISIAWDGRHAALDASNVRMHAKEMLAFCEERGIENCVTDDDRVEAWLSRRLNRQGIPRADGLFVSERSRYWSLGLETTYSLDRARTIGADLTEEPRDESQYSLEMGFQGALYVAPSIAFTLRGGWSRERNVSGDRVEVCRAVTSGDPAVEATACEDVIQVLAEPQARDQGYARFAVTYLFSRIVGDSAPGLEGRINLDHLGTGSVLRFRAVGFFSPVTKPFLSRFGVGVEVLSALGDAEDGRYSEGDLRVTPFAMVGATY